LLATINEELCPWPRARVRLNVADIGNAPA